MFRLLVGLTAFGRNFSRDWWKDGCRHLLQLFRDLSDQLLLCEIIEVGLSFEDRQKFSICRRWGTLRALTGSGITFTVNWPISSCDILAQNRSGPKTTFFWTWYFLIEMQLPVGTSYQSWKYLRVSNKSEANKILMISYQIPITGYVNWEANELQDICSLYSIGEKRTPSCLSFEDQC